VSLTALNMGKRVLLSPIQRRSPNPMEDSIRDIWNSELANFDTLRDRLEKGTKTEEQRGTNKWFW
jgi:hypothetical protein